MEFRLNGYDAYVITDTEQGCFINNCNGFYMEAEQMIELGKKLIATGRKKGVKEDILEYNRQNKIEYERKWSCHLKEPTPKATSHIYLMKCGDKYKIGVSNNVEKRKKQLDNRPFPVEIIAVSPLVEGAYEIERELHEIYSDCRIDGEWFNLTQEEVEGIKLSLSEEYLL